MNIEEMERDHRKYQEELEANEQDKKFRNKYKQR